MDLLHVEDGGAVLCMEDDISTERQNGGAQICAWRMADLLHVENGGVAEKVCAWRMAAPTRWL